MVDSRSILLNVNCESQFNWFCRITSSTPALTDYGHTLPNSLKESRLVQQKPGFRSALWIIPVSTVALGWPQNLAGIGLLPDRMALEGQHTLISQQIRCRSSRRNRAFPALS